MVNPWRLFEALGASRGDTATVEFVTRGTVIRAQVPSNQLWVSIKDVLVYEDYEILDEFRLSALPRGATVLDAGAFVGFYSLKASQYASRVVSLEPNTASFRLLKANIDRNRVRNVECRSVALTATGGPRRLEEAGTISEVRPDGRLIVDSVTLDALVEELGMVDLMKVDIEGAEHEVFGAGISALKRIDKIVAEVHVFNEAHENNLGTLVRSLEASGHVVKLFPSPMLNWKYAVAKPWACSLKRYNEGRALTYRLLLSFIYGAGPLASIAKQRLEIGRELLLFAHRKA